MKLWDNDNDDDDNDDDDLLVADKPSSKLLFCE